MLLFFITIMQYETELEVNSKPSLYVVIYHVLIATLLVLLQYHYKKALEHNMQEISEL